MTDTQKGTVTVSRRVCHACAGRPRDEHCGICAQPAPAAQAVDEDAERAAFEAQYAADALVHDGDEYLRMAVQMAWEGWQARAALAAPVQGEQQPAGWEMVALGEDGEVYRHAMSRTQTTDRDARYCWGEGVLSRFKIEHRPLFYAAPVRAVRLPDVDDLAEIIRRADGNHSLGAGALAEKIIEEVAKLKSVQP